MEEESVAEVKNTPSFLIECEGLTTRRHVMRTAEMCSRSYFADFWIDRDQQLQKLGYDTIHFRSGAALATSKPRLIAKG